MNNRKIFRETAKKLYKKQAKAQNIPKNRRMSFSQFFKQYLEMRKTNSQQPDDDSNNAETVDDFDFENMVNVNEISDEDVEVKEKDEST